MTASELAAVDAVAFDVDGVLVDARNSYDEAIEVVTETMVKELTGKRLSLARAAPRLISALRRTGGFNSDWDTTYALTVFSWVVLNQGGRQTPPLAGLVSLTQRFGSAPRKRGIRDADAFLAAEFPELAEGLGRVREYLQYPGSPPNCRMSSVFDKLYMGRALYKECYRVDGGGPKEGFIEMEKVLIAPAALRSLEKVLGAGRLAMVTGRPSVGTAYTFGKLMSHFDRDASMFIGDGDVYPDMRAAFDKYRKPSPEALIRAAEKMSSKVMLYAGDSAEDLMMVKDAQAKGKLENCLFAGVYGMSPDARKQVSFFEKNGADLVVRSVNEIPSRLLMASKSQVAQAN